MYTKCKIAVGIVGENAGERHVANIIVGGWHEERRSVQRLEGSVPPRDKVVIVQRLDGSLALSFGAKSEVLGARFMVLSYQLRVSSFQKREDRFARFAAIAIAKTVCAQRMVIAMIRKFRKILQIRQIRTGNFCILRILGG